MDASLWPLVSCGLYYDNHQADDCRNKDGVKPDIETLSKLYHI